MLELACILSLAVQEWIDFAIIAGMLLVNAIIGVVETLKARKSLLALTEQLESTVTVVRNGVSQVLMTRLLVPDDVILLVAGASVPADVGRPGLIQI